MRVTAQAKAATRQRILTAAQQLFAAKGFEATTTRDISEAADIATGTLFNYFATKEAVLACLATEATTALDADFRAQRRDEGSFEEALFAFVAAGLRKLRPWRQQLPVLLETALNPLAESTDDGVSLRSAHLETVTLLARRHRLAELGSVPLQLYWTLYTGVLMFWANDRSPKQEDTLALLDHSLSMFVGWLQREIDAKQEGAQPCPR